jgi:cation diffusion facilitator family transporter
VAHHPSIRVVYVAVAANLGIAASKYFAAAVTGSPAMLAEAFHSTADTGNELLLLLGMKRSARKPDALHPFGHGKVLYFYSLLVAVFMFGVGGIFAGYRGISRLLKPETPSHVAWNYMVLAIATVFEGYSWFVSRRQLRAKADPNQSSWDMVVRSKDPVVFTVFLEDSAALVGIAIAFAGVLLGDLLRNPYLDPIASIVIAFILAAVAILLGRESGALLVGESANSAVIAKIRQLIGSDDSVVGELLTMQLGPDQVFLAVDIKFRNGLGVQELEATIDRLEHRIRTVEPTIQRIFIEAESLRSSAIGGESSSPKYAHTNR